MADKHFNYGIKTCYLYHTFSPYYILIQFIFYFLAIIYVHLYAFATYYT
jgi:hypothetical protein